MSHTTITTSSGMEIIITIEQKQERLRSAYMAQMQAYDEEERRLDEELAEDIARLRESRSRDINIPTPAPRYTRTPTPAPRDTRTPQDLVENMVELIDDVKLLIPDQKYRDLMENLGKLYMA